MKNLIAILLLFLTSFLVQADQESAVCRLTSNGGSCTVIWTSPTKSYLLTCGHCFESNKDYHSIRIDAPSPDVTETEPFRIDGRVEQIGKVKPVGIKLVALDHSLDLALLEMGTGPLPYVDAVAPLSWQVADTLLSCGYDSMKLGGVGKPQTYTVHILRQEHDITYTREPPWHGRSGGGLLDRGYVVGVCHAYTVEPRKKGMYVSLSAIHRFLKAKGYESLIGNAGDSTIQPQQIAERPRQSVGSDDVDIPQAFWVGNGTGRQCVWCALETLAKYLALDRLNHLTQTYTEAADDHAVESVLQQANVWRSAQWTGDKNDTILRYAVQHKAGCMIGVSVYRNGHLYRHAMVLVGYDDISVRLIDNGARKDPATEQYVAGKITIPRQQFDKDWDGWAVILWPDDLADGWVKSGRPGYIGDNYWGPAKTNPAPQQQKQLAPIPRQQIPPKTNPQQPRRQFQQPSRPLCPT